MSYEGILKRCFSNLDQGKQTKFLTYDNQAATMLNFTAQSNIVNSLVTLVEGVHFLPNINSDDLAYKALVTSYSKLMAFGATPLCFQCNISMPSVNISWLRSFSVGLETCMTKYGGSLVGSSLVTGKRSIAISVMGQVTFDTSTLGDNKISVGDKIFVTGTLGDSGLALKRILQAIPNDDTTSQYLEKCLMHPQIPLDFAVAARKYATAGVEILSGFSQDLDRVLSHHNLGADIELEKIPLSPEITAIIERNAAYQCAFTGSDDCQLCLVVNPDDVNIIYDFARLYNTKVSCVGEIVPTTGLRVFDKHGDPFLVKRPDHDHFAILDELEGEEY
ncbi:MAG: AIR synthase related protein [Pseudomonadota bacterium]|nr:AIR synthase related protein [Pseudomonadota bacterium]